MSPWAILQIDASADSRTIKRAYARLLKLNRPDDDPEGFQRLHQAGWPHQNVAGLYAGATAVLAVLQLLLGLNGILVGAVAVISAGVWLDQKAAVPFA